MSNKKNTLVEYTKEIMPLFTQLQYQKNLLKDFKESDEKAVKLAAAIKEAQEELKAYLENNDDSKAVLDKIKEIDIDIKEAVKAAVKYAGDVKPAELKAYYIARSKEDGVVKVVKKGNVFEGLEEQLEG